VSTNREAQRSSTSLPDPLSPFLSRLLSLCRGLNSTDGGSLVEVALIISLLGIPMMLGTAEIGILVYDSIEITNAAHAAASYGAQSNVFAANTSGMTLAAQADATDFGVALTATPTTFYACSNTIGGTRYTGTNAQSNATAACTSGTNHAIEFVQVTTSAVVTPKIHLPGLLSSFTLTGISVMEVQN
jgi:Flp pilus assembly protein TadG